MSAATGRCPRRGVALPTAIGAIALLAALAVGGVAAARDELRGAHALAAGVRARSGAESAVAYEVARWDVGRNLRLAVGAWEEAAPPLAGGGIVRAVRIGPRTFVLDGRATVPAGPPGSARFATRRVRMLVRLPHLLPDLEGAVTVFGALAVPDGARVSGADVPPDGWDDCGMWGEASGALPAVAASDGSAVGVGSGASAAGGVRASASAGDSVTYRRFGEASRDALAARADVVVGAGAHSPTPSGSGGRCHAGWGEPRRGYGAVAACVHASPLVHARGAELALRGSARGQGILLVDGDLRVEPGADVEWAGLVVVRGRVLAGGALRVRGALMVANADGRGASDLGPGADVAYSSCAVARAAIAVARPAPMRRRAWAEVTR